MVIGEQRIDVEFGDLLDVDEELRQLHQSGGNRLEIGRRPVAISFQEIVDARLAHEVAGKLDIERRQCHRTVPHHLGGDPARSEQDDRPEQAIL